METLWQDIRLGFRTLAKAPVFTAAVVLTLGLGIGANAAVFSIVDMLLLRPLPVRDPGGLYVLAVRHEGNEQLHNVSWLDYQDFRDKSGAFEDLAAYDLDFVGLSADKRPERITISYVTNNFFSMLGVTPALGRVFGPADPQQPGAHPGIVLDHAFWTKRFNADPSVVGKTVLVNGKPFVVEGVVPPSFKGVYALIDCQAYVPLTMEAPKQYHDLVTKRDEHNLHVIGRIKAGLTPGQAQAAIDVLATQLEAEYPTTNKTVRARMVPERLARPEANAADQNPIVAGVFLVLVGLVLLVACVNVVNLVLVRATVRQRDMALRAALGAARRRLVQQMMTESLILAALGAVSGAAIGRMAAGMIARIKLPVDLPVNFDLAFDWRVFAYIGVIAAAAGVAVGLFPALRASRADLNSVLREGGRGTSDGAGRQRVRSVLVVAQVAVSLVLLVAAGLFIRSVMNAQSMDLGFDPTHVENAAMDVASQGYDESRGRAFYDELLRRVQAVPGVESASFAFSAPMGQYNMSTFIEIEGQPPSDKARQPSAGWNAVSPGYLETMKLRLARGRFFTNQDDEHVRHVAVVNEFMAKRFWNGDPIGKRFRARDAGDEWIEVVGVVHDAKVTWIFDDPAPYFYLPIAQQYRSMHTLQVRTAGDAAALAPTIVREIHALDPDLPTFDVAPMTTVLQGPNGFFLMRLGAMFGMALGLLGLTLALVGVYGVVSYTASQRTQEIGIRMALGAGRTDVMRVVLGRGLLLVAGGLAAGLALAAALARVMTNLLFNVSPLDPLTFIGVPLILGGMAVLASCLPALRATRIDPAVALRS